jgi:hypothetical protein
MRVRCMRRGDVIFINYFVSQFVFEPMRARYSNMNANTEFSADAQACALRREQVVLERGKSFYIFAGKLKITKAMLLERIDSSRIVLNLNTGAEALNTQRPVSYSMYPDAAAKLKCQDLPILPLMIKIVELPNLRSFRVIRLRIKLIL